MKHRSPSVHLESVVEKQPEYNQIQRSGIDLVASGGRFSDSLGKLKLSEIFQQILVLEYKTRPRVLSSLRSMQKVSG